MSTVLALLVLAVAGVLGAWFVERARGSRLAWFGAPLLVLAMATSCSRGSLVGSCLGLDDFENCKGDPLDVSEPCGGGGGGGQPSSTSTNAGGAGPGPSTTSTSTSSNAGGGGSAPTTCHGDADCQSPTQCATPSCDHGTCVLTPTGSGTTCDDDGGKLCDGDGKCVACLQSTDCTSTTACVQVTCDGTHACVSMNAGAGDGCSDNGGAVCDGLGTCVACNQASDCALPSTVCVTGASCDAHACAYAYADEGTACTDNHGHFCDTVGQCYAAASVAVAFDHTCVVTTVGGLKCWGYDDSGDLVDGMNFMQPTPSDTMYTTGVARVVTGQTHTCVQTTGGAVKCYGADMENALGTGTSGTDQVVGLTSGVTQIAANGDGSVTCALLGATGGLKCWGANIGVGAGATPQDTPGLTSQVTAVSVGAFHLCAIVDDGSAFAPVMRCLGQNADGQLGDGTMNWSTMAPVDPGMQLVVAITTGDSWSCAASTQGYTWCWGSNNIGQLGADSTVTSSLSPRIVDNLLATSLASGSGHSCAITPQHKLMCWGWNFAGQIGNGTTTTQFGPAPVALPDDVASIGLGDKATCAVLKTGELYCWGNDQSFGGTGNHVTTPTKIPGF